MCYGLKVMPTSSFDGGVLFITNQTYAKAMEKDYALHCGAGGVGGGGVSR
ncbi:MAG: hypothetical protein LBC27_09930 [Spirochaetaceae bacterium]|nr:hypothetical protein [Spirochaetaceae bacterium]